MTIANSELRFRRRSIDQVYTDAMLLADEARSYFDDYGRSEREALPMLQRVSFSCESLKVTTRLMFSIAWLLMQRAVLANETSQREALDPSRRLGGASPSNPLVVASLPIAAQALIRASEDLYERIARMDAIQPALPSGFSPTRSMQDRLTAAF